MNIKLALLPGDGIGPEVCDSAIRIMRQAAEKFDLTINIKSMPFGGVSYEEHGTPLTNETIQECYDSDAVLLGAVGGYKWENLPRQVKPETALLKLRKSLGLYANIRPAKVFHSMIASSSIKQDILAGTDFVVFRELTGGIYFGEPRGLESETGWNTMKYSKKEIELIAVKAFESARSRNKKVTSVDKANVLEVSQLWRSTVTEIQKDFADVELNHMYVDNAAMQLVRNPKQFDVILTSNLFGDILSDVAGMITGSLGMLPSASIGSNYALYEPVHGSAPDIAGKNKANPVAAILSAAMMFEYSFQMNKAAGLIYEAVDKTLEQGFRTEDIHGAGDRLVSTAEMTDHIIENFEEAFNAHSEGIFLL